MDEIVCSLFLLNSLGLEETEENVLKIFSALGKEIHKETIAYFLQKLNGQKISEFFAKEQENVDFRESVPKPVEEVKEEKTTKQEAPEEKIDISEGLQALFD